MKAAQREPWLKLSEELTKAAEGLTEYYIVALCSLCRYHESGWDVEDYGACNHPIETISERVFQNIWESDGGDCWAFRPRYTLDLARANALKWIDVERRRTMGDIEADQEGR